MKTSYNLKFTSKTEFKVQNGRSLLSESLLFKKKKKKKISKYSALPTAGELKIIAWLDLR